MKSPTRIDANALLDALRDADLMNTGCRLNDGMDDEYVAEVAGIVRLCFEGQSLHDAVVTIFEHRFWQGCLDERSRSVRLEQLLQTAGFA